MWLVQRRASVLLRSVVAAAGWPCLSWALSAFGDPWSDWSDAAGLFSALLFGALVLAPQVPSVRHRRLRQMLLISSAPAVFVGVMAASMPAYSFLGSGRLAAAAAGLFGVLLVYLACRFLGGFRVTGLSLVGAALVGGLIGAIAWNGFAFSPQPEPGFPEAVFLWQPLVAAVLLGESPRAAA